MAQLQNNVRCGFIPQNQNSTAALSRKGIWEPFARLTPSNRKSSPKSAPLTVSLVYDTAPLSYHAPPAGDLAVVRPADPRALTRRLHQKATEVRGGGERRRSPCAPEGVVCTRRRETRKQDANQGALEESTLGRASSAC